MFQCAAQQVRHRDGALGGAERRELVRAHEQLDVKRGVAERELELDSLLVARGHADVGLGASAGRRRGLGNQCGHVSLLLRCTPMGACCFW